VSPDLAYDLARQVADLYSSAEDALLRLLRRSLSGDMDAPGWARQKAAAIGDVRRGAQRIASALEHDASGALAAAVAEAYRRGDQAAVAELGALAEGQRHAAAVWLPQARSVDRLAASAVHDLRPVYTRIVRAVVDVYQQVTNRAVSPVLLGALTRRQGAQQALDAFAARGITGFTDRAGRNWQVASYAEMAVRTVTGRAAIDGHTDRLAQLGQRYVVVSSSPLDCPRCHPWEGAVLRLSGPPGPATEHAKSAVSPATVAVHVAGSVEEARAAGLLHPNCRHSLSAYLPGVTRRPESPPHPHGATYDDTQTQRYYERQVRAWKRRALVALDDDARRSAEQRVRAYQAKIRALVADKGLKRKPVREQLGTAR